MPHAVRRPLALALAALVVAPLLVLFTAPAASAGPVFSIRFAGRVATAAWSSCPATPAVGDVCTETVVIASDATTSEKGFGRVSGPRIVLQRFAYEVVDLGGEIGFRPVFES